MVTECKRSKQTQQSCCQTSLVNLMVVNQFLFFSNKIEIMPGRNNIPPSLVTRARIFVIVLLCTTLIRTFQCEQINQLIAVNRPFGSFYCSGLQYHGNLGSFRSLQQRPLIGNYLCDALESKFLQLHVIISFSLLYSSRQFG